MHARITHRCPSITQPRDARAIYVLNEQKPHADTCVSLPLSCLIQTPIIITASYPFRNYLVAAVKHYYAAFDVFNIYSDALGQVQAEFINHFSIEPGVIIIKTVAIIS